MDAAAVAAAAALGGAAPRKKFRQTFITAFITTASKRRRSLKEIYGPDCDIDSDIYPSDDSMYSVYPAIDFDETPDWEQEGALLRHRESSYLDPQHDFRLLGPYCTTVKINYDWCKLRELKRFVHDRLLTDPYPQGLTLRYFYIRALEKNDREWCFRFMDLPSEMRLMVYRNLLLHENPYLPLENLVNVHGLYKTYPAILQTCRHIYEEAHGVLYDENTFQVTFKGADGDAGNGVGRQALVHRKTVNIHCPHAECLRIPKGIDDYPEFFRRISRLQLRLKFETWDRVALSEDATWPLNHFVYTLASFLMDGHRLKTLQVKLDVSSALDDSKYGMILYPLRRLRNVANVSIEGHAPDIVKTKLINDIISNEPTFNTMRHWNLVAAEGRAQLDFYLATHDEVECECGECQPDCIEELRFQIQHLNDLSKTSCFSSLLEERFLVHLHHCKTYLNRINPTQVEALIQAVGRRREAMAQYNKVSDNGRLEEAAKVWTTTSHSPGELMYNADDDWSEAFEGTAIERADDNADSQYTERTAPSTVLDDSDLDALNESSSHASDYEE